MNLAWEPSYSNSNSIISNLQHCDYEKETQFEICSVNKTKHGSSSSPSAGDVGKKLIRRVAFQSLNPQLAQDLQYMYVISLLLHSLSMDNISKITQNSQVSRSGSRLFFVSCEDNGHLSCRFNMRLSQPRAPWQHAASALSLQLFFTDFFPTPFPFSHTLTKYLWVSKGEAFISTLFTIVWLTFHNPPLCFP